MTMVIPNGRGGSVRALRPDVDTDTRPQLRVVPRRSSQRRARLMLSGGLLVLFVVLFVAVAFHVTLVQNQQRIDTLTTRADEAQTRYDKLRVTVDHLQAPSRIVRDAGALGLVQPGDATWLSPKVLTEEEDATPTPRDRQAGSYNTVKPYLGGTP